MPVLATPGRRLAAACLDAVSVLVLADIIRAVTLGSAVGVVLFMFGFAFWGFCWSRGSSPGKMTLNLQVVRQATGAAAGFFTTMPRDTVGKLISALPLGIGFLGVLRHPQRQGWHDRMFGTLVVQKD